jgi:hypothetical protein
MHDHHDLGCAADELYEAYGTAMQEVIFGTALTNPRKHKGKLSKAERRRQRERMNSASAQERRAAGLWPLPLVGFQRLFAGKSFARAQTKLKKMKG